MQYFFKSLRIDYNYFAKFAPKKRTVTRDCPDMAKNIICSLVREGGLEPPRHYRWILNPVRLPFRHSRLNLFIAFLKPTRKHTLADKLSATMPVYKV